MEDKIELQLKVIEGMDGRGQEMFAEEKGLSFAGKALSIFVQTDKKKYKPGDTGESF